MKITNLALAFTLFGASAVAVAHADHDLDILPALKDGDSY